MPDQPIGYWLKLLDRLIDDSFDQMLAERSLTRRHWQILRSLSQRPMTVTELDTEFAPFLTAEQPSARPTVADLSARGWVSVDGGDGTASLTPEGEHVHAELWEQVRASRARATHGISGTEYQATIDVLSRMAANLQRG